MNTRARAPTLAAIALLLAACGASVKQAAPQLPAAQVPPAQGAVQGAAQSAAQSAARSMSIAKIVLVAEPADEAVAKRPDWPDLVAALTAAMAKASAEARIEFSTYAAGARPAPEAGTWVTLKVLDYKLIGSDKRFSLGAMAGSGQLDAEATFADLQSGRELARRKYSASSGAFQGVFSAPSERQLDVLSAQVIKDVLKP
jgi:hypothetical protein